jgi:hypothetical protein
LFFWRWPTIWREEARDGAKAFHEYFPPPCFKVRSPPIKEQWIRDLDMVKLEPLIKKRYLEPGKGRTKITIPRHPVPKGPTDIWVVWNCTGNGVNPSTYTPLFHLATGATPFRRIETGMEQDDFDIDEDFHNYVLVASERPYHGVLVPDELCKSCEGAAQIMRWTVPPFGWTFSP